MKPDAWISIAGVIFFIVLDAFIIITNIYIKLSTFNRSKTIVCSLLVKYKITIDKVYC